ncbi:flagellar hook assembly protein FlgD [Mesobacillus boroniphilus]|uniref:Basal-body rod modification protein FlgD n=1 Tax=Mesobacillus boroniphilus TaxID=308892 RepID=A0A944CIS0_9BACI|nr:flagellar hook assembly protein FlgD [Mesobacillus boroniphilus]MBS8263464.1 flagellar hook assembly protein FlgD [Mesobacillus boroniphilus]
MVNTINSSYLLSNLQKGRKAGSDILGKDDFLKILMTQLQNQDPLNPMQDKDFIAQMATFSTLEQITNMGKSIDRFVQAEQQNKMISYSQFVGKEITWHKIDAANGQETIQQGTGKVASVQFKEDTVSFILEDGTVLEPANISQINELSSENHMLQASMLIGKTITYLDENKQEKSANVLSVSFKNGKTSYLLDDENNTSIISSQITKIQ